jgi:type IV secretion system protein TrbJ
MKPPFVTRLKSPFPSKRSTLIAVCLTLSLLLVIPTCAYAIFGIGDIVYDPSNFAEAVEEVAQDIQLVRQAIQTYDLLKSELQMISSRPWQTLATALDSIDIQDLGPGASAAAQAIATAVNGVSDARAAWSNATLSMPIDVVNAALSPALKNTSAPAATTAVQMTDAFATDALRTIGLFRKNEPTLMTAIANLQMAQESTDPDDNTPVAQQNLTNGILLQLLKLQQSAASLHAVVTEQLAAANSWQRNTAAEAITMQSGAISFRTSAPADYANTSTTLTNYLID